MKNYELVLNQKQVHNLEADYYVYNSYKEVEGRKLWRCQNRKCSTFGYINSDDVFVLIGTHKYNNSKAKIEKKSILNKILEKGKENNSRNISVITENTSGIGDAESLYTYKYLNDQLTRDRSEKYKSTSRDIDDIPSCLKFNLNNNLFLQYDNNDREERIIIFFSDISKIYVENSEVFLIDGTFWSVPSNFYQLLTIKVGVFGNFYSLIYILLSKKTKIIYTKAFEALKTLM